MNTFTDTLYQKYYNLIYQNLGVYFNSTKKDMLQAKLDKLLRLNSIESYEQYYELLKKTDNQYWTEFVDEITVHQTNFFREDNHFEFIRSQLRFILDTNKRIMTNHEIRVWSAGCSTGEEPYTLGMVLKEWLPPDISIKILATDISSKTLARAQNGIYPLIVKKDMDPYYIGEYFERKEEFYNVAPVIKDMVTFRLFNLIDPFPFQNTFDFIFCRNVMIYFDNKVQQELIAKFFKAITPGGLLFIGHSESLVNKQSGFEYLQPTIYLKKA